MTDPELPEPTGWWRQVPRAAGAEAPWTSAAGFVALCVGPAVALARDGVGWGWSAALAVAAVAGGWAARQGVRALGPVAVGATALAAAALVPVPVITPASVLLAVVGAWWLAGRAAVGDDAARCGRIRPAVAVAAAAAGGLLALGLSGAAVVLAALALALAALTATPVPARWLGVLDRPIEAVSRFVGALAGLPALVLVSVRWATDRVVGHDPLRPDRTVGWVTPPGAVDPTRLHAAPRTPGRWRSRLSALLVVALIAAPLAYVALRPDPPPTPAAVAGDPDWAGVHAESEDLTRRIRLDPTTMFRLPDYVGEHVNVVDGRRRTWQPPPCDCPRYRVWWFGASSAWGMFQRDDETLPSEVAKAAWARGVALEIENRATPGFVVDQEVRAVEAALEREPPPDLIVVFDGANDATMQVDRNAVGRGDDRSGGPDIDRSLSGLSTLSDLWADLRRDPRAGRLDDAPAASTPPLTPDELADHVAARFRANVASAEALAAARGTEVLFLWQPTVASTPLGTGDPAVTGGEEWAEVVRRTPGRLDGVVTDLSGALTTAEDPVFVDEVHLSETGAALLGAVVATEVLAALAVAAPPP